MLHNRKRVLLTGNCKYELTGLHHLLTDIGCEVMYQGIPGSGQYDLIVIALSAEPLAGWGKHLQNIRELYAGVHVPMIVLVPPQLQALRLLKGVARIYNGRDILSRLETVLRQSLDGGLCPAEMEVLTCRRQRTLMSLHMAVSSNTSLKPANRREYYHRARLVEYVGVDSLHVLCMSGLVYEVCRVSRQPDIPGGKRLDF